jgi:hypothetical protein
MQSRFLLAPKESIVRRMRCARRTGWSAGTCRPPIPLRPAGFAADSPPLPIAKRDLPYHSFAMGQGRIFPSNYRN